MKIYFNHVNWYKFYSYILIEVGSVIWKLNMQVCKSRGVANWRGNLVKVLDLGRRDGFVHLFLDRWKKIGGNKIDSNLECWNVPLD